MCISMGWKCLNIAPSPGGIWAPPNTCFLGITPVFNPKCISIESNHSHARWQMDSSLDDRQTILWERILPYLSCDHIFHPEICLNVNLDLNLKHSSTLTAYKQHYTIWQYDFTSVNSFVISVCINIKQNYTIHQKWRGYLIYKKNYLKQQLWWQLPSICMQSFLQVIPAGHGAKDMQEMSSLIGCS